MYENSNSKTEESTIIHQNLSQFYSSFDQFYSEKFKNGAVNTPKDFSKIAKIFTTPESKKKG